MNAHDQPPPAPDDFIVRADDAAVRADFAAFLAGQTAPEHVQTRTRKGNVRTVWFDVWSGRRVVVKRAVQPWTVEAWCWRRRRPPYAMHAYDGLARARADGARPAYALYLAAERWAGRKIGWESYQVSERLDGPDVRTPWPPTAAVCAGIRDALATLHRYGLVHGDPNPGNFIVTADGVRAIDVSGKAVSAVRCAMDRVLYEAKYAHPFGPRDAAYWVARGLYWVRRRRAGKAVPPFPNPPGPGG